MSGAPAAAATSVFATAGTAAFPTCLVLASDATPASLAAACAAWCAAGDAWAGALAITGPVGTLEAMAGTAGGGAATICGACRGCGTILREAALPSALAGADSCFPGTRAWDASAALAANVSFACAAGETADGFAATAIGGAGMERLAASSFCCNTAFITSPGLEIRDRSIFGFGSEDAAFFAPAEELFTLPRLRNARTRSASSSSRELEWVFFSLTPTCVSASRTSLLLTSSSRARSLIRTLLIRLFRLLQPQIFRGPSPRRRIPRGDTALIIR